MKKQVIQIIQPAFPTTTVRKLPRPMQPGKYLLFGRETSTMELQYSIQTLLRSFPMLMALKYFGSLNEFIVLRNIIIFHTNLKYDRRPFPNPVPRK